MDYPTPDEVRAMMGLDARVTRGSLRVITAYPGDNWPIGTSARDDVGRCVYCGHEVSRPCVCSTGSPDGCTGGNHGRGVLDGVSILSLAGQAD